MNDNPFHRLALAKVIFLGCVAVAAAYGLLLIYFPEVWAIGTAVVFVLGSGLFTSKVLLSLDEPWVAFGLAPVFGTGWLVFFWLLLKVVG